MKNLRSSLVASVAVLALVACASSQDEAPGQANPPAQQAAEQKSSSLSAPAPTVGATYVTTDLSSPFETITFEEGGRYVAMRRPCGSASCDRVEERGRYEFRGAQIVFIDDATGSARPLEYSDDDASRPSGVAPRNTRQPAGGSDGKGSDEPKASESKGSGSKANDKMKMGGKDYAILYCSGGICGYGCGSRPGSQSSSCPGGWCCGLAG